MRRRKRGAFSKGRSRSDGDAASKGPREIKDGGVTEGMATNQLDTYAKKFCLTRKMIINDDLGAFPKVPTSMGNRATRLVDPRAKLTGCWQRNVTM